MLSRLFIAALWSPAGKGLNSWLLFVMSNCDFVTFPCGILGQVWYLIALIPDLCRLSYFGLLFDKFILLLKPIDLKFRKVTLSFGLKGTCIKGLFWPPLEPKN